MLMRTAGERTISIYLSLRRDLYDAVLTRAQRAGLSANDFCYFTCIPELEQTGVRHGGSGKVVRATFAALGNDFRAELVLTQDLYLTLLGIPQGLTVEHVCREACREALARATGLSVNP
jgi:hypothetical protein